MIDRYVFDNPWPLVITFLLAAAICVASAVLTGRGKPLAAAALLAAVVLALFVFDGLVETPGEEVAGVLDRLTEAARRRNADSLVHAFSQAYQYGNFDYPRIAASIRREIARFQPRAVHLSGVEIEADRQTALARFVVVASGRYSEFEVNQYLLRLAVTFQREAGEWRIVRVQRFEPIVATHREIDLLSR
jgi:hypothetical protein